jgi:hypothetical protein
MKTPLNGQEQKERITELRAATGLELECESEQFKDGIRALHDSLHKAAERPDAFWTRQRAAISESLRQPAQASKLKPILRWAPTSIIVLMCLLLFTGKSQLPAPDFSVGADQNLLVDVERALYRDYPEALAPVATLVQEIK